MVAGTGEITMETGKGSESGWGGKRVRWAGFRKAGHVMGSGSPTWTAGDGTRKVRPEARMGKGAGGHPESVCIVSTWRALLNLPEEASRASGQWSLGSPH